MTEISREQGQALYDQLIAEMEAEFPRFKVIHKRDSRFQKLIHHALVAVTLGGMREYLSSYQTTMGYRVFVTDHWDGKDPRDRYITMRHERVHMRQFRRYSMVGMALLYLLCPVPMGLSYCRARFEWEAYRESLRASCEVYGLAHVEAEHYREGILRQFTGPSYGWMWPFRGQLGRWYDAAVSELRELATGTR